MDCHHCTHLYFVKEKAKPLSAKIVVIASLGYLLLLFLIASYAIRRANLGKSIVNNPYIYALSLAVYCTAWTFYGSVGRAAHTGLSFVAVYLGPTIAAPLWYMLMRKIILISKKLHITSIVDFISSRYGKSTFLGIITTLFLVIGIIPYISIQLKAIGSSFEIITRDMGNSSFWDSTVFYKDKVNYITILLAVFTILFGTRHLDPNERHEGLIAAIAFESVVKLCAFVIGGIFIVYFMFNGFSDIFTQASQNALTRPLLTFPEDTIHTTNWFWVLILSAVAAMFLPRQFHVTVVENTNVSFVRQASWMFPLYMLLINVFVLPIALAGMIKLPQGAESDMFLLSLPLMEGNDTVALIIYLGGFSAAASMVAVSVISLSIMVSNNLMMPLLLKSKSAIYAEPGELSSALLQIRRAIIVVILFLAYGYYKLVSHSYPLVSIGLISFAAILQIFPALLGGLYWHRASKRGAIWGISVGFFIWCVTLPIPTLAESGLVSGTLLTDGYFGLEMLRPHALFGIENMEPISHACFWSMLFNVSFFVIFSMFSTQDVEELAQGDLYINIEKYSDHPEIEIIKKEASVYHLKQLLIRFLGSEKSAIVLQSFDGKMHTENEDNASQEFINYVEKILTGAFGAASAKLLISPNIRQQSITIDQIREILNQTKEIIEYSKALEVKTSDLQKTSEELAMVNMQLKELDVMKAEFISTVTHELRTPITTIRSFTQLLDKKTDLTPERKKEFIHIILKECDRVKRLISQILEVEKIENSKENTQTDTNVHITLQYAIDRLLPEMDDKNIKLIAHLPAMHHTVALDEDKLLQVFLNLLTNAIKFCDQKQGLIAIQNEENDTTFTIHFINNGKLIPLSSMSQLFQKFTQIKDGNLAKPEGSGLGLFISKAYVEKADGIISVTSDPEIGTKFSLTFPKRPNQ